MQRICTAEQDPYASPDFWPMLGLAIFVMALFLHPPQWPRTDAPQTVAVAAPVRTPVPVKVKSKAPPPLKKAAAAKNHQVR